MSKHNLAEVLQLSDAGPSFKDGDDGGLDIYLDQVIVQIANNGYTVIVLYEDGSTLKYVFTTMDEVVECLRSHCE